MAVTVIGVDGTKLACGAEAALESARVVVGVRRHLRAHAPTHARHIEIPSTVSTSESGLNVLSALSNEESGVVLTAGDPGLFGAVHSLRERGIRCEVLPMPSELQRIMAHLGRGWDDVTVVNAHGENLRQAVNVCRARSAVAVLTGAGSGPAQIGAGLQGWRRTLVVGECVGEEEEKITTLEPSEARHKTWREPNVVLSFTELDAVAPQSWMLGGEPAPPARGWGLDAEEFSQRDGMVSATEVRAVALSKLAPRPGALIWDVAAGSGAMAVESARLGAAAIAVEADPVQCVRIIANAGTHGVDVRTVEDEAPQALRSLPRPDGVFVGGGDRDVLTACAHAGATRIVVAISSMDRVTPGIQVLSNAGYEVAGAQLAVSRLSEVSDGSARLSAEDPVTLMWGIRKESQ